MANAPEKSLFITGAGGFVGKRLLQRMPIDRYGNVYCLCRKETPFLAAIAAKYSNVTIICADLFQTERYRDMLADSDIAVHLAAVTGKAAIETYFRVNTEGTAVFIEQCKRAGVRGFLHFSTIAVKFQDVGAYPYARSKQAAEKIVAESGLAYTIVRPTIIFGRQSPIWQNFLAMARAPVPFVFGNGRTKIQPIHVDDLIDAVVSIIDSERFDKAAYDLGGGEVVTIEALVRQIRQNITGRPVRGLVRIPLFPLSTVLRALEPLALGLLPFTAGQLTSFSSDGVAANNLLMDAIRPQLRPLDEMIDNLIQGGQSETIDAILYAEGRRLGKMLSGSDPPKIVLEKYANAHRQGLVGPDRDWGLFERIVLGTAKAGPLFYLAEAYCAVFHRTGLLRKKMVLLLAILECIPDMGSAFDKPESGNPLSFLFGALARSLVFAFALLISTPIFFPLQVLFKASEKKPVEASWKN